MKPNAVFMFEKSDEEENKNDGNMKLCSFLPPSS
jgi:hypothetical protein